MQLHRWFGDEHYCDIHIGVTSSNKWSPFALVDYELPRSYVPITYQVGYVAGRGSWGAYLAQVNEQKCTYLGSLLKFDSLTLLPFSYAIIISKERKKKKDTCHDINIQCYPTTSFQCMFMITLLQCKGEVILKKVALTCMHTIALSFLKHSNVVVSNLLNFGSYFYSRYGQLFTCHLQSGASSLWFTLEWTDDQYKIVLSWTLLVASFKKGQSHIGTLI